MKKILALTAVLLVGACGVARAADDNAKFAITRLRCENSNVSGYVLCIANVKMPSSMNSSVDLVELGRGKLLSARVLVEEDPTRFYGEKTVFFVASNGAKLGLTAYASSGFEFFEINASSR